MYLFVTSRRIIPLENRPNGTIFFAGKGIPEGFGSFAQYAVRIAFSNT